MILVLNVFEAYIILYLWYLSMILVLLEIFAVYMMLYKCYLPMMLVLNVFAAYIILCKWYLSMIQVLNVSKSCIMLYLWYLSMIQVLLKVFMCYWLHSFLLCILTSTIDKWSSKLYSKRQDTILKTLFKPNLLRYDFICFHFLNVMIIFSGFKNQFIIMLKNYLNLNTQKEYKRRHDWVEKVIHWELCKRLNLTILTNSICTN